MDGACIGILFVIGGAVAGCLLVAGCRWPVAGCGLRRVAGCRLRVKGCRLPVASCLGFPALAERLATSPLPQATRHRPPASRKPNGARRNIWPVPHWPGNRQLATGNPDPQRARRNIWPVPHCPGDHPPPPATGNPTALAEHLASSPLPRQPPPRHRQPEPQRRSPTSGQFPTARATGHGPPATRKRNGARRTCGQFPTAQATGHRQPGTPNTQLPTPTRPPHRPPSARYESPTTPHESPLA
jgi:hypothetical protein